MRIKFTAIAITALAAGLLTGGIPAQAAEAREAGATNDSSAQACGSELSDWKTLNAAATYVPTPGDTGTVTVTLLADRLNTLGHAAGADAVEVPFKFDGGRIQAEWPFNNYSGRASVTLSNPVCANGGTTVTSAEAEAVVNSDLWSRGKVSRLL